MRPVSIILAAAALAASAATPAAASEIFGGAYVHDVDTAFTLSGVEGGADLQVGWRGDRIIGPVQPYAFVSAHTEGQTHFAAVGLSAKFGDRFFIRPGLGLAIHTGSSRNFENPDNDEIEFGSRILFEPEVGIGTQIGPRTTLEASWVHISGGQIFGRQNPGMDSFGARLSFQLP